MKKFLAVIKREYVQRVRSRMFIVVTVLGPLMLALFTVLPALIAGIEAGGPTRVAVIDESGQMFDRFQQALNQKEEISDESVAKNSAAETVNANQRDRVTSTGKILKGNFKVERASLEGRSLDDAKRELSDRIRKGQLDIYIVLPRDILERGTAEFYGRNTGDVFTKGRLTDRLTTAVRDQRLAQKNIAPELVREINRPVTLTARNSDSGDEKDSGAGFYFVLGMGFVIYLTILLYGQVILGAVIEEKETRIAEILFSSIRSFPLMMGKLLGVSMVALTQLTIWGLSFIALASFGPQVLSAKAVSLPDMPPVFGLYFALFFLLGYFIYSTIYALVGSMVTTSQEGGQMAMPVVLLLVVGFYLAFPVIRSPNSSFAFWVSMVPFFSPITMLVRIVTEPPPVWQIILSLGIGFATVTLLIWLASRIYRVGMLMYGKRATIPEVIRWLRQS
ncbi:MAG: type transport system permease protein [Blastocatellia bacterium]|jgi:ABC-2 type transport system permease protein|nr:type transport system permease protein [Blastocatellia bacterium]